MLLVKHRVNTIELLKKTPKNIGVEIDIRSNGEDLILHHEPFSKGISFNDWLKFYEHSFIILNVKEEGLEEKVLLKMKENNVKDFFFLDQSFPFLIKTVTNNEKRTAVRFSEFESIETVINLSGMAEWVWIDCFNKNPIDKFTADLLRDKYGFKLCFVSPELQGKEIEYVKEYIYQIKLRGIKGDAVCSKRLDLWI